MSNKLASFTIPQNKFIRIDNKFINPRYIKTIEHKSRYNNYEITIANSQNDAFWNVNYDKIININEQDFS
jgi:hypothetical protein